MSQRSPPGLLSWATAMHFKRLRNVQGDPGEMSPAREASLFYQYTAGRKKLCRVAGGSRGGLLDNGGDFCHRG